MRFGVLGPLAVWRDDGAPVAVPGADLRALLAVLLVHEGAPVPVERLIGDLWPDALPARPANALQVRVSRLRRVLGRELIEFTSGGYRLGVPAGSIDAGRFQFLLGEARATEDPAPRGRLLTEALALWRGDALADFAGQPFAQPVAERLVQQRLAAVEELAETRLDLGEHDLVLAELAEWVHRHPHRERLRAAQLRAIYRTGRQGEALQAYDEFRRGLAEAHGLDPGPELAALQRAILARDPTLAAPPPRRRTNLPAQVTELVGRDEAIAEVTALLGTARLVTLTGTGGVGKTRLGLAVAERLADAFPDGVWLVELAGTHPGDEVAEAVMTVLGLRENTLLGPLPAHTAADHLERLSAFLRDRSILLLLDNCEHVAGSAADLTRALLAAAPGLRVLATGREPLGIPGEVLRPVPPLELPEPGAGAERVRAASAVRLFHARAADADPGFTVDTSNAAVVADLVRRLDGLPLALELAAARTRALGVPGVLARLDDRFRLLDGGNRGAPARQRTLSALLGWSWELLTEAERAVLRRLSVLDSGELAAVEAICADDSDGTVEIAGTLARLVDRSMVVVTANRRYRLLATVAAYARTRLAEANETHSLRDRHSRYYLSVAEEVAPGLFGPEQRTCLARLDAEQGNFHCALENAAEQGDAGVALRLVDALAWYLLLRGRVRQVGRRAARALAVPGDTPSELRARVRCWEAGIAILRGADSDAVSRARQALDAFRGTDDPPGLAMGQWFLGYVLHHVGALDFSEELAAKSSAGFHSLGHAWGTAVTTSLRAHHTIARGDLPTAADLAEESLAQFRALDDLGGELLTIYPRAAFAEAIGDHDTAERLHRDGLRLADELGMWAEAADRLSGLGKLAMLRGDHDTARRFYERARALAVEHSFKPAEVVAITGLGLTARRTGDLAEAEEHLREAEKWYRRAERAPGHPAVVVELGLLAQQGGDHAAAASQHSSGTPGEGA
ncbi:winged helix-turn-helix domain-containing protein [Saccharothrix sp. AJ9571]|nr:winged helix-turn-helix domain-containing protein [Saccharothrix sp. AJ9571]